MSTVPLSMECRMLITKHKCHLPRSAELCSHAAQFMQLSRENLRRNCNLATLFLFINELAIIWCGRQD